MSVRVGAPPVRPGSDPGEGTLSSPLPAETGARRCHGNGQVIVKWLRWPIVSFCVAPYHETINHTRLCNRTTQRNTGRHTLRSLQGL